ncbi:uncharacterized protein CLUP02_02286, partial [Colletotrichum lupini]
QRKELLGTSGSCPSSHGAVLNDPPESEATRTRTVARSALRLHGGEKCQSRLCGDKEPAEYGSPSHVQVRRVSGD